MEDVTKDYLHADVLEEGPNVSERDNGLGCCIGIGNLLMFYAVVSVLSFLVWLIVKAL